MSFFSIINKLKNAKNANVKVVYELKKKEIIDKIIKVQKNLILNSIILISKN